MSPEQSVLCGVSSHFAERDIVRSGDDGDVIGVRMTRGELSMHERHTWSAATVREMQSATPEAGDADDLIDPG